MPRAIVILLALLCCPLSRPLSVGSARAVENANTKAGSETSNAKPALILTTTVVGRRYCKQEGGELGTLTLRLRARFTNVGQTSVILFKGDNLVSAEMISRSEEDALKGVYESYRELHSVFSTSDAPKRKVQTAKPTRQFVVLRPHAYFDTNLKVLVTTAPAGQSKNSTEGARIVPDEFGGIVPGRYVLQVTVSTWLGSSELASSLLKRWEKTGRFWSDNLTSQPMPFTVDKNPPSLPCG